MQISPVFNIPAFTDSSGDPLPGAKIYAYEAGSFSVLKQTFTSQSGDTPNSNPIVLDSGGRLPAGVAIWLEPSELYNLVLTNAGDTVLQSFDNVSGVPIPASSSGPEVSSIWVETPSAVYLSATSFLVPGNFSLQYSPGNRARLTQATGFTFGTVTASTFSSPNTEVTIINDGVPLNSSLSGAEYSVLVVNAETVDAGAVSYTEELPYSTANTVGNKLKSIDADIDAVQAQLDATLPGLNQPVYPASGEGVYVITPTIPVTTYSTNAHWTVRFVSPSVPPGWVGPPTPPTFAVSALTALPLKQYDSTGALVPATVSTGLLSEVAYDAGNDCFILLDQLPEPPATPETVVTPRGIQVFASNGVFTVPTNVSFIKVTCVGGGGGGAFGYTTGDPEVGYSYFAGGGGGSGATTIKYIATTPGTTFSVAVGAGGAAALGIGAGGTGGSTSFGVSLATAGGGLGGWSDMFTSSSGGAGGTTGTGDVRFNGVTGLVPRGAASAQTSNYGAGGDGGVGSGFGGIASGNPGSNGICLVEY